MFKYQLSAFADEASQVVLEQIAALKKNNVSLIELRGVDGTSVARLTDDEAKEARKKLDDAGNRSAYRRIMDAVVSFDMGNATLSAVLEDLAAEL